MGIISKIDLIERPEQHVLSIRRVIDFDDYPDTAKQTYQKIIEYARQSGLLFAGGPFVCYHNTDLKHLDVEMGFPVARPASGKGDISGCTIPAHQAVSGIFLGAYEESDPLMFEIIRWIGEHGFKRRETIYHYYLNDDGGTPVNS